MEEICRRFNERDYHDSMFFTFKTVRKRVGDDIQEDIVIELGLYVSSDFRQMAKATLTLKDCWSYRMSINVPWKICTSSAIDTAECLINSECKEKSKEKVIRKEGINEIDEFLHFYIELCDPTGEIDVLAKDFELIISDELTTFEKIQELRK